MIEYVNGWQISLNWGNKLVEIDLFFYSYKNELLLVQRTRIIAKSKNRYHNGSGKKKLLNLTSRNREVLGEEAKIDTKAC